METSDPKTENLNQLKDPQYMVHLHKSIIENLTPRDTALERVQKQHILQTDPKQRRDSSFYKKNPPNNCRCYTSKDIYPQIAWVLSSWTETQTAEWPHILDTGTKLPQLRALKHTSKQKPAMQTLKCQSLHT